MTDCKNNSLGKMLYAGVVHHDYITTYSSSLLATVLILTY